MVELKMMFLKLLKAVVDDIVSIVKISKDDFFDSIEMLSFGLIINGIYGITSSVNMHDFLVIFISLYIVLKVKKERRGNG